MRAIILAGVAAFALASAASAAPNCSATTQLCGQACIPKSKVCHITPAKPKLNCTAGNKQCGGACIKATLTCHKP